MSARLGLLVLPMVLALPLSAQSVELDFSSLGNALIEFNSTNSTFGFTRDSATGATFQIGNSSADPGMSGYKGTLTGSFSIGTVSTSGSGPLEVEEAPVTGSGTLTISDGTSDHFTAQVDWSSIVTLGGSGALNATESINLSDFSYNGSNPALLQLGAESSGVAEISFQFAPAETLTQLTSGTGMDGTTFSGSLAAIPEPGTDALIAGALALCATLGWKLLKARETLHSQPILIPVD